VLIIEDDHFSPRSCSTLPGAGLKGVSRPPVRHTHHGAQARPDAISLDLGSTTSTAKALDLLKHDPETDIPIHYLGADAPSVTDMGRSGVTGNRPDEDLAKVFRDRKAIAASGGAAPAARGGGACRARACRRQNPDVDDDIRNILADERPRATTSVLYAERGDGS
jgi:hypothetical protein